MKKKRLLAWLMTMVMAIGLLPATALADTPAFNLNPPSVSDNNVKISKKAERTGEDTWKITMEVEPKSPIKMQPLELVLLIDTSTSMALCVNEPGHSHEDNEAGPCSATASREWVGWISGYYKTVYDKDWTKSRIDGAYNAAKSMLESLKAANVDATISIVGYNGSADKLFPGKDNTATNYDQAIAELPYWYEDLDSSTNMSAGLKMANECLTTNSNTAKAVVMLGDGEYSTGGNPQNDANQIKKKATLYTVAFAAHSKAQETLKKVATEGKSYTASTSEALTDIFNQIAGQLTAMIVDDMGSTTSSDVKVPANGKISVDGKEINTGIVAGNEKINWNPDSALTKKTTITYPVQLKDIQSLNVGDNIVDLNGSAKFSYQLVDGGKNYNLNFNCPTDKVVVGQVVENYYVDGTKVGTVTGNKFIVSDDSKFTWSADDTKAVASNGKATYYSESKVGDTKVDKTGSVDASGTQYVVDHYYTTTRSAGYTVEHYLEQTNGTYEKDTTATTTGTAEVGTTIDAVNNNLTKTFTDFIYDAKTTATEGKASGEVTADGNLTLQLYYSKDTWNPTNPPGEGGGDNFPDNRQVRVVYQAATGGTIQGTTTDKPKKVEGFDLDGTTGTVNLAGATADANDGYTFTGWTVDNDLDKVSVVKAALANAALGAMNGVSVVGNTTYTFTANFVANDSTLTSSKTRVTGSAPTGLTAGSIPADIEYTAGSLTLPKNESITLLYAVTVKNTAANGSAGVIKTFDVSDNDAVYVGYKGDDDGVTVTPKQGSKDEVTVTLPVGATVTLYYTKVVTEAGTVVNTAVVDGKDTTDSGTVVGDLDNVLKATKTRISNSNKTTEADASMRNLSGVNYEDTVTVNSDGKVTLLYKVRVTNTNAKTRGAIADSLNGLKYEVKDEGATYIGYVPNTGVAAPKENADGTVEGTLRINESVDLYFTKEFDAATIKEAGNKATNTVKLNEKNEDTSNVPVTVKYKVTYEYTGTTPTGASAVLPEATYVAAEQPVTVATAPALAGYTFSGWTTSDVTIDTDGTFTMPADDVTLTGSWTEDTPEAPTNVDVALKVVCSTHANTADCQKNGVTLGGNDYTIGAVSKDSDGVYTVTVSLNDSTSHYPAQHVKDADKTDVTALTFKYVDKAWTIDGNQFVLHVKAEPVEKVTVSFDLNYFEAPVTDLPPAQTINKGTTATEPTPAPARDGYNFEGWYEKVATGELSANAFDFTKSVNEDVTLYAKWTEIVPEAPEKPETLGVRLLVECTTHGELKDCEIGINPLAKEQYTIGDVYQIGTGWAVKVKLNNPDSYVAEDHETDSEAEQQTTLTFSYVDGKWVANDGDNEFNIYIKATEETKPIDPIEGEKERVSERIDPATMINWVNGEASEILDELNFDAVPVIEGPEGVTLLYKVTVTNTGETAATYTVTDEDATFVGWEVVDWETTEGEARPVVSDNGETATGTLPGNESIDLYFTKTFVATDVEDGEVVNTAVVNGEDVPDEGTEVVVDGVVVEKDVYKINGKKVAADAKVKDGDTVTYKITVTNKDLKAVENLKVVEKPGTGLKNGAWTDEDGKDLTKSIAELIAEWFAPVAVDDFAADETENGATDETTADDSVADETATGETTVDDSVADETATENGATDETTADDSAEDETVTENVVTDTTEDAATNEETVDETATDAAEEDVVTNETTAEAITEAANATDEPFVDEDGNVVIPFLDKCDEEGDSVVLYYTVTVDTSEGKVANTVIVTDEDDNELAKATTESDVDNSDDEKVPAVKVTKEIKDKAVKRGEWAVYTITVTNTGEVDLENLIVTDTPKDNDVFDINTGKFVDLPKGVTFVDGDDKTVVRIDELEVGKSIELTFKVQVASDAEKNATLENTVVVKNDDVRKEATNDDGYVYKPSSGGSSSHHKKPSKPSKVDEVLNTEDHFQYVQGYPDGTVGPERNITRAEATVIFFRLLQDSVRAEYLTADNEFPDVKLNDWFNLGISTMENGGFVSGYEDGLFRPNGYITRAELATIISNFDDLEPADENKFADVEGHWAEKYINSAAEKGWLSGYEDGLFRPNQYITRAETMSMINRVLNRRVDADGLHADAKQWKDNPENAWYYYAVLEATNYHEYERKDVSDYENWTAIKPEKIWEN